MKLMTAVGAALAVALLLGAPLVAQESAPEFDWTKAMQEKAASVVSIKCVLKIQLSMMGQTQDREQNSEVRGILVNATGLVLTSNSHFDPSVNLPRGMMHRVDIKATPTDLKVLFGNEEEEYEAQIVARDSNLDLAFVQILDLGDRKVVPIDLAASGDIKVGQKLYGVSRLPRGFDCAPAISKVFVSAKVEKPRTMWAVSGNFSGVGLPLFDMESRPVGILCVQKGSEGVEEVMGAARPFVLPAATVLRSMKAAESRAAEAVEEARKKAEEEKAAAEEGPGEEEPGEAAGEPEKPEKPDEPKPGEPKPDEPKPEEPKPEEPKPEDD